MISIAEIDKKKLVKSFVQMLSEDLASMTAAAAHTRDAAINEESKSEDKHDTRSIEAGYLAAAQSKRVSEIKETIAFFNILEVRKFSAKDAVSATALIELSHDNKSQIYFFVPKGGGLRLSISETLIQTITPQTPLGEELLGVKVGDSVMIEGRGAGSKPREFEVVAIA